jgi:nitroreductase
MQLKEAIVSRESTKRFNGKAVSWKKIIEAIDLARHSPMAGNIPSVKFVLVQDKKIIKKIADATQQTFVQDASAIAVVVSDREKVLKMYDYNQKGFAQQQAGAMIENFLLALTEKKIAHCWVGFFDDSLVKEAIALDEEREIEALIVIGERAKIKQEKRAKPELETILFFEKWGTRKMEPESRVRHEGS